MNREHEKNDKKAKEVEMAHDEQPSQVYVGDQKREEEEEEKQKQD